jgi:hypothetical protein
MSNGSKGWNYKDINFRMSKKSKQMLVENRVSSSSRVIKGRREITVGQEHGNSSRENRQRQE